MEIKQSYKNAKDLLNFKLKKERDVNLIDRYQVSMLGMEISAIYIFCAKEYLKDMNFGVFLIHT